MASSACPISLQLSVDDPLIPFVDADGSCDGSVSSIGTGSVLGHSTSEEEGLNDGHAAVDDGGQVPWKFGHTGEEDHDSLNNMLDTVSSETHPADLVDRDYLSVDRCFLTSAESGSLDGDGADYETLDAVKKPVRPTTLRFCSDSMNKDYVKCHKINSLMLAYSALSDQQWSDYESIYNNSMYGGGGISPSKSTKSGLSTCSPVLAHHYISSVRASMRGSASSTPERDPCVRLQLLLKKRYLQLSLNRPVIAWCPDFQPPVRQMMFNLARDSSWEKAAQSLHSNPTLRKIPIHAILADDRRWKTKGVGQRILIVGETGYGKTTLMLRLLADWSSQEANGYLGGWKLVHLVACRDYANQRSLSGCIKEEAELAACIAATAAATDVDSHTLFLLDGLDEFAGPWPTEIVDLLEGRLHGSASVIATSRPVAAALGWRAFDKRIVLHGLQPAQVHSFVDNYLSGNSDVDCRQSMVELVVDGTNQRLVKLASCPLMCVLLCLLLEEHDGWLPDDSPSQLFALMMRFVMARSLQQPQKNMSSQQRKVLLDFGRLSLQKIKENRYVYTDAEIKSACQSLDIVKWGFLVKSQALSKGQKRSFYQPIHCAWSEYTAALYLSSIAHYSNILQREVYTLPLDAEPCFLTSAGMQRSSLQVLFYLCSVLSKKAYLLFNILSPLDFPAVTLLSLLQTSGRSNVNVAAICQLIQGNVTVLTSLALELQSWAALVDHPSCQLLNMTIRYDSDYHAQLKAFVDVLARNATINSLKITAVVGQGIATEHLLQLAHYLGAIVKKARLQTLELSVSSVDDDVPAPALQPLMDAVCASIDGATISKLVLDMDLSAQQVGALCQALSSTSTSVRSLHFQHLSCQWSALQALTALIGSGNLTALDLSGCWAPNSQGAEPAHRALHHSTDVMSSTSAMQQPSTNGTLSATSLAGSSSTGTALSSSVSPYSPSGGCPSGGFPSGGFPSGGFPSGGFPSGGCPSGIQTTQRHDAKEFLSLPRRTRGSRSYSSLTRGLAASATASSYLCRSDEKRRSDSMLFQKVLLPLPACDRSSHLHCGFHLLFDVLRNSACHLTQLNLSKSSITVADAMCLGESVRKNRTLISLRLEGLSSLKEVLPVVLSLAENGCLQLLDVSSNHVLVSDSALQLICRALGRNRSLQSLRMCGWTFCLEDDDSFKALADAVQATTLRELALSSALIRIPFQDKRSRLSSALLGPVVLDDLVALMSTQGFDQVRSDWLAFLKLDNCRLELSSKLTLRGAHLVFFTTGFQRLTELNLSLDEEMWTTGGGGTCSSQLSGLGAASSEPLRDKATLAFFRSLAVSCSQLRTLLLHNWKLHWSRPDKVLKGISKAVKRLSLSNVSMDGVQVRADAAAFQTTSFPLMLISTLSNLTHLSLNGWSLEAHDAVDVGRAIRDKLSSNVLELSLKQIASPTARLIIRTAEESGKVAATHAGSCVYRFKKTGRNTSFFNRIMCMTSSWQE